MIERIQRTGRSARTAAPRTPSGSARPALRALATGTIAVLLVAACGNSPMAPPDRGVPLYGACGLRPNYVDDVRLNRWPSFPLSYFFDAATFGPEYRETYRSAIAEGIRRWDRATPNDLGAVREVEDRTEADFVIVFGIVAPPETAAAAFHSTGTPFLAGGVIGFNAPYMEGIEERVDAGEISKEGFAIGVANIAAHEMGHVMGIIGHADGGDDLMGTSRPLSLGAPTTADVNTLTHAYCR